MNLEDTTKKEHRTLKEKSTWEDERAKVIKEADKAYWETKRVPELQDLAEQHGKESTASDTEKYQSFYHAAQKLNARNLSAQTRAKAKLLTKHFERFGFGTKYKVNLENEEPARIGRIFKGVYETAIRKMEE
jgi:hypothetical protein